MIRLRPDVYWVGVNDRSTDLFEGVWPIPEGISYNSYFIDDEKKVLIDSVKEDFSGKLIGGVGGLIDPEELDYVVVNHMEPDHSGTLSALSRLAPEVEFIGTEKAGELLESYYGITEGIRTVEDGEEIDLGEKVLRFYETPFVHWPETMMSYLPSENILFSCDAFGSFGTLDGGIFDDELDISDYEKNTLRYFSNIVGAYTTTTQVALKKLADLDVGTVAPSHGPIWRDNPDYVLELYDRWSKMEGEPGVTLVYGSMYGNTREVAEKVTRGLRSAGCENVELLDASRTHESYLLAEAWKREGLIVGAPTYESGIFPPVREFMELLKEKQLKNRVAAFFGSFGWGGGSVENMESIGEDLGWDVLSELKFKGRADEEELEKARSLAETVAEKVIE